LKAIFTSSAVAVTVALLLAACGSSAPPAETLRSVRTAEVRYEGAAETTRYFGSVQSRYEVEQAFRVPGKVVERRVDVGQTVREGDVLAVLDDVDYRLTEQATREQLEAAKTRMRQAESDSRRLQALKEDGSVSEFDEEHAQSELQTSVAAAEAEARKLELARNRLKYTVLQASQSGVITAVRFEVGQVVAEGQPVVSIADPGYPEVVVDVPEGQFARFQTAQLKASLAVAPDEWFEVVLRELSPQAASETRTFRAKLKPATGRELPLGATAFLVAESVAGDTGVAAVPASAITQAKGQAAVWVVRRTDDEAVGSVELVPVEVHGYRNEEALVSGAPDGALVVTAGVQKMAPGLKVALLQSEGAENTRQVAR